MQWAFKQAGISLPRTSFAQYGAGAPVAAGAVQAGDVVFFDSFAPHASKPNRTDTPRRLLYLTYNLCRAGDHRARYHAEKHAAFPPDIERDPAGRYVFRV